MSYSDAEGDANKASDYARKIRTRTGEDQMRQLSFALEHLAKSVEEIARQHKYDQ